MPHTKGYLLIISLLHGFMKKTLFVFAMISSLILVMNTDYSYADVISPKKQSSLSFAPDEIVCKEALVKLIKQSNGKANCVEPSSAAKLAEMGWASPLSDQVKEEITVKKAIPAGTINHLMTLNQIAQPGKLDSSPRVKAYNYVFETCAGDKNVRAPEIVITSDSEVKSLKLASMLKSNQCRTTSAIIKANDSQSITSVLLNKGGITKTITDMENNLNNLSMQLEQEKKLLTLTSTEDSKKTSAITQKITDLKKQINSQRYDLQKYQLFLFSDPKSPSLLPTATSFTGKPIDSLQSHVIMISEQVYQPRETERIINYNVMFEACANELVRIPMITVHSDYEEKDVTIAEKISPNTCQMSVTSILAKDHQSIKTSISSKQSTSSKISEIEKSITELQEQLDMANKNLENLLVTNLTPEQLANDVTRTTTKISELRSSILAKKAEVAAILLQVYSK